MCIRDSLKGSSHTARSAHIPEAPDEANAKGKAPLGRCKYCQHRVFHANTECCSGDQQHCQLPRLYKDNDMHFSVCLSVDQLRCFNEQIERDTQLLREMCIMDYSLLLGVQYSQISLAEEGSSSWAEHRSTMDGGSMSMAPSTVSPQTIQIPKFYFFGLIDVLQDWSWRKVVEGWWKGVFYGSTHSSIEPIAYQERFMKRVVKARFKSASYAGGVVSPRGTYGEGSINVDVQR
eukprot:TRINITY_DN14492_c0_g1_i1.p1 TRINITY_DN14492_c0_g1~~TRINITY_DN14492_c0_g1_i1.p1  ORF type:complete len:233 (+),score=34.52 TRINITY_DN14492_c0_g1_i1:58-756(+)